ncbi:hypothetical protein NHX12_005306 [Muraenolepis orangiensis]|uniref:Uncharacterized protein n=1 Tax=Muraenolepis orangiensis TaxID=630683 RepID=A0A9Q0DSX2_9TELE|nr:hypothetical protein NHX12_005306 [Muraenolepis orangiensis]
MCCSSDSIAPEDHFNLDGNKDAPPKPRCVFTVKPSHPLHHHDSKHNPMEDVGYLSFLTFSWTSSILWGLYQGTIDLSSYALSNEDAAERNERLLRKMIDEEAEKVGMENVSFGRVVLRFQFPLLLLGIIAGVIYMMSLFIGTGVITLEILTYIEEPEASSLSYAIGLCFALFTAGLGKVFFLTAMMAFNYKAAIRIKGALNLYAFKNTIHLRGPIGMSFGEMINILTTDGIRIFEAYSCFCLVVGVPMLLLIVIIYATYLMGVSVLIGFIVFFFMLTLMLFIARILKELKIKTHVWTDLRVNITNEVLTFIKLIKMYAWEDSFEMKITEIRKHEKRMLLRIKKLALLKNPEPYLIQERDSDSAIVMENATLYWTKPASQQDSHGKDNGLPRNEINQYEKKDVLPDLRNISFTLPKGHLLGVCGSVASGKSSLIYSILEQLHLQQGSITASGTFAYVSQQAWIFHGTVQENILMGQPLEKDRYDRVIDCCCLKLDLKDLPYGDNTEIGERGLNLSGGQKQRISLARAVYSDRDIILLDDPLSAVDAHVGKHIFENCIKKELRGKSIILVTHQLQYLESCDGVLFLEGGAILESGKHKELMKAEGHYAELITSYQADQCKAEQEKKRNNSFIQHSEELGVVNPAFDMSDEKDDISICDTKVAEVEVQLVKQEVMSVKAVSLNTYHMYVKAAGGYFIVIASPMSFFDCTPVGRILNRFSVDQNEIDVTIPIHVDHSIHLNQRGICHLKRSDDVSRSPWISFTGSTVEGLCTIHAYEMKDSFIQQFKLLSDTNSFHFYTFFCGIRLLVFGIDSFLNISVLITALLVVLIPNDVVDIASKGLALSYCMQLTGLFTQLVKLSRELEGKFSAVERMQEYITTCVPEGPRHVKEAEVPEDWPKTGSITFHNFKMRYRENTPLVLKGIQIHIKAGESVGIVGRTGSGKSSLGVALFRLVEAAEGSILIDGVDIAHMGLEDLRSRLAIIPQDPVLFAGTIRYNLDPFSNHSDEELWDALNKTHLKDSIARLPEKLAAVVKQNGENFSIILLDEATASIDAETGALIQKTITEAFRSCTTLTIAHRINTILQSDRILVMDQGQVLEFDHPDTLRQNANSMFSILLKAANTVDT